MSMRAEANKADPNRLNDIWRTLGMGDLMNKIIAALAATETGLTPASNVVTLANQPTYLYQVNVTAGTTTGIKALLGPAPISGPGAVTPAAGQVVWDGGKKLLFAAADAATAVSVTYAQTGDTTCSILTRDIGQVP